MISLPIAKATARERAAAPAALVAISVLVVLGAWRREAGPAAIFADFSALWLAILTILLGAGILSDEVDSGHAQLVLLRPISRASWVGGRFTGAAAVLVGGAALAWAAAAASAIARGTFTDPLARLAVLPLELLPALGWLATMTAASAIARRWGNVLLVLGARLGWGMLAAALPFVAGNPDLAVTLRRVDAFVGPRPLAGRPFDLASFAWDLAWLAAWWAVAALAFQRRELARRRA